MNAVVVTALLVGASGCQVVFPREVGSDLVRHVRPGEEAAGTEDLIIPVGEPHTINTGTPVAPPAATGSAFTQSQQPRITQQDGETTDLAIVRVRLLDVEGTLNVVGDLPLVIIADSVVVDGLIDASGHGPIPGPGGGTSNAGDPGQGGMGLTDAKSDGSDTGGGGGGFAEGAAGSGATVGCSPNVIGAEPADAFGDPSISLLIGGGAGGRGGSGCEIKAEGGGGGGAIQISATTTIEIHNTGRIISSGGGGGGGVAAVCPLKSGGGGGGGAGGAIYLSAQTITNEGALIAHGGGGGAGARDGTTDGLAGTDGFFPSAENLSSDGGLGLGVGTNGGKGATLDVATPGMTGMCAPPKNTGGGGGSLGRIVLDGFVARTGRAEPAPFER